MAKRKWQVGIREATGMHLSRVARGWYWTAWVALIAAFYAMLFAEVMLRVPDTIGFYPVEAIIGLITPLACLFLADYLTTEHYLHIWQLMKDQTHASIILESKHIELIRYELRHHWLLRWIRPAKSPSISAQLFAAALWWQAVVAPEGTPWLKRYWEPLVLALGLIIAIFIPLVVFSAALMLTVGITLPLLATALASSAVGLGMLSISLLRTTARWQAIVDYFAAWRDGA